MSLTIDILHYSLKNKEHIILPQRDFFGGKAYYKFSPGKKPFRCYKDQRDSETSITDPNHHRWVFRNKSKYSDHLDILEKAGYTTKNAQQSEERVKKSNISNGKSDSNKSTDETPNNDSNGSKAHPSFCECHQPMSGLKLSDIESDDRFLEQLLNHNNKCTANMKRVDRQNYGHGIREAWVCKFCNEKLIRYPFPHIKKMKGQKMPMDNLFIPLGAIDEGVMMEKLEGLFASWGCCAPSKANQKAHFEKVKEIAWPLLLEQVLVNRRDHVHACRTRKGYKGDVIFYTVKGSTRMRHSIARGPMSLDGNGPQRWIMHRVKGVLHLFICMSHITRKAIYIKVDQISCRKCSDILMNYVDQHPELRYFDIKWEQINFNHPGKCHRNSTHGPGIAEEYAAADAARYLLLDEKGEFLPGNLAIIGDEHTSDGDMRGPQKFIQTQQQIVGFELMQGLATHFPDGGHMTKTVSNAIFKLRNKNKSFGSSLNTFRISAIAGDFKWHIKRYHYTMVICRVEQTIMRKQIHAIDKCDGHRLFCVSQAGILDPCPRRSKVAVSTGSEICCPTSLWYA